MSHTDEAAPSQQAVVIDYANYRAERTRRTIIPGDLYFGETAWRPGAQWLLDAYDVDRGATRTFALKDVHSWTPVL